MLNFNSLSKRPKHFLNFTGLTIDEFNKLISLIADDWQLQREKRLKPINKRKRKLGGGRRLKLFNLEDRILVFTIYAKHYLSYLLLEYLFNIDESNVCRIVQEISPLLSKKIIINRRQGKKITTLKELKEIIPDLDEVLVDTTEQKIPRPKKKRERKKYHSGKKKCHTFKTQIVTNRKGLILYASDSSPGRPHDYKYFKQTEVPKWLEQNPDIKAYGDLGYQGVNKDYPKANFVIPIKRKRNQELTRSEKIFNTKHSKKRIIIEHTFANLKKYRILSEIYRNSKEHYSEIFKSIAFLSNLRMLERGLD